MQPAFVLDVYRAKQRIRAEIGLEPYRVLLGKRQVTEMTEYAGELVRDGLAWVNIGETPTSLWGMQVVELEEDDHWSIEYPLWPRDPLERIHP